MTLQDIADHLGVSKFAVSRALAGKDGVSPTTRQRIADTAVELGYSRPVDVAPAQPIIQIVFAEHDPVNSELWMQMQNGIQGEAAAAGFQVQTHWAPDAERVGAIAGISAGFILVGQHSAETVEAFRRSGQAMVRLGWVSPLEQTDQVSGADHEAGNAVGQYLIARGHRRIAFVHGSRVLRGRMERLFGLREAALACAGTRISEIQFSPANPFAEAFLNLSVDGELPTALFCSHDSLGVFVVSELHRLGYSVPDDVSVIGYGDFAAATQISPMLTTLRLPGTDMGIAAFRTVMDRLDPSRRQLPPQRLMLVPELIERDSVANLAP
ncbi:LacI family DNA-binding transcriptional regulator [Devosia sp. RR2S18]|uniref:LacI family DNA-binding transcriptional regulator n=1 Tax=Devosia rhizosphaerae TaxID=3049774 RepID=UPI00254137AD|nr:LacI family DNA-binding transcriptional regulator [Devosia sp. RR2S18]WIJ27132.1 LacI family DNA-binding transcriptional regulator [Devosia sp. RR2S18]